MSDHQLSATDTTSAALTNVSGNFAPTVSAPALYRVFSNRLMHIVVARGTPTADATEMPVNSLHPGLVKINSGESLSYIRDSAEIDGTIWFTKQ